MPIGPFIAAFVLGAAVLLIPALADLVPPQLSLIGFLAIATAAAVTMGAAASRCTDSLRKPRGLLAVGWFLAVLAGVLAMATGNVLGHSPGFPGFADVLAFVSVACVAAALIFYPFSNSTVGSRVHAVLDGGIAATAIWFIIYSLVLVPNTAASGIPSASELSVVAYPAAATFMFGVAISMVFRVHQDQRRELSTIAFGLGLLWLQEIARAVLLANGNANGGGLAGALSLGAYLSMLFASLIAWRKTSKSASSTRDHVGLAEPSWDKWLPLLSVMTVGAALLVAVFGASQGIAITSVGVGSVVLLILLLLAEQLLTNRELGGLNDDLTKNSQLFENLVTGSSDLITLHEVDGTIKYASPAVARLLELPTRDILGKPVTAFIHPEDLPKVASLVKKLMKTPGEIVQFDIRVGPPLQPGADSSAGRDKPWRWVEAVVHNMLNDANVSGIVVNTRDIHEQQLLRQRLSYEAYHDPLTGLGNLALARRIFSEHCYGSDRAPVTMILADLDGFKTINDTFGHSFGDDVLVAVARRIRGGVDDEDQIARIGGDEFVFILDPEHDADAAAEQIIEAIKRPFLVQGQTVNVAASLGIARSLDAVDAEELVRNADLAMYSAKAAGGARAIWYDPAMHEETAYRLRIQDGLRRALNESSFELHYQPIVSLPDGEITGAEALLRWEDTTLGRMFPDVFIPIAESSGLSPEIDEWVMREACSQLRKWWDAGVDIAQMSVNVSRRQLGGGFAAVVERALVDFRIPPRALCVEVTESAVVGDENTALAALTEIRNLGVCIALDDFGTGESSLSQLSTLPVDRVKIDKSFVMPSSADGDALRLLESIVGVCRTMGMPIVAEGVEDETAVANLAAMRVDFAQGYYFHRPMPANEIERIVRNPVPRQRAKQVSDPPSQTSSESEFDNVIYRKFG